MMLSQLVHESSLTEDVAVHGLCEDSRLVREGDLFCAVKGEQVDGRNYIETAINRGAVAVLCDQPAPETSVPVVAVDQLRNRLGSFASRFYGEPSEKVSVIAVTGTNGKTSFTHLLAQALTAGGMKSGLIGTMGHGTPGSLREPGLTTPTAIDLQRRFAELAESGCESVVLEASSHGLVQGRLNGTDIDVAVFTNITHDHLDYHESFDGYRQAKQILFQWPSLKGAVVNLDDEFSGALVEAIEAGVSVVSFSTRNPQASVYCAETEFGPDGVNIRVVLDDGELNAQLPLFGLFNVENLLAVVASLKCIGWKLARIESALAALTPVAGRMDVIRGTGKPTIIVDYAHTPDALEKCLEATRQHFGGRRIACVFGCGGDRDTTKRPMMGAIASKLADVVFITSDNPRSEDPATIIEAVAAGVESKNLQCFVDRGLAIRRSIESAGVDDVVLIAGKGHEDYQELASGKVPFSDYDYVAQALVAYGRPKAIVGLGETGLSYARHLKAQGYPFVVLDDNPSSANKIALSNIAADAEIAPVSIAAVESAGEIFLSPGVPLSTPAIATAISKGKPVRGDVELFGELATAPIVAITGTNGKSTVSQLIYEMAAVQQAGVALGGNIGTPCLDLLNNDASLYVLELSSYQLEIATKFRSEVAMVLNLAADHLDRYPSIDAYFETKLALYKGCRAAVVNREMTHTLPDMTGKSVASFGVDAGSREGEFGLLERDGQRFLANGSQPLIAESDIALSGQHNLMNILAALATGWLLKLDMKAMIRIAQDFKGLPHRCEIIAENNGVIYINDSKATNPGAMLAAVAGQAGEGNIILIAGGVTKGADFSDVGRRLIPFVREVLLIGESQSDLLADLGSHVSCQCCDDLHGAVQQAARMAEHGDVVLLSPGCASFDQFKNFAHRGDTFRQIVEELVA